MYDIIIITSLELMQWASIIKKSDTEIILLCIFIEVFCVAPISNDKIEYLISVFYDGIILTLVHQNDFIINNGNI